jgi:hypothetical protein
MRGKRPVPPSAFWSRVQRSDGCWEWTGKPNRRGYCEASINGLRFYAHRVAYSLAHPDWEWDSHILHRCDNPRCVNPDHLYSGFDAENAADRVARGHARGAPRGILHPSAKLTVEQVVEIRERKVGQRQAAQIYGVTEAHIWAIRTGQKWRHV